MVLYPSCTAYTLSDYLHTPLHRAYSNPVILHFLHMAKPSENTFVNHFIHPFRHSAQLRYPSLMDFVHPPDIKQTSDVVYFYSPNPRPLLLLPCHCLNTIYKNSHEQYLMLDPSTLNLQTLTFNQRPNSTCNSPPNGHTLHHLYLIHPKHILNI